MEKQNRVGNFVAEAFIWTLLAYFMEVNTTATIEQLSLGGRYVLHDVPWYSLQGHTTMWDLVDGVGLTALLRPVVKLLHTRKLLHKWWARGLFVMVLIYVLEFLGGLFFNKLLKFDLWDYSQYVWRGIPLHLMGQITLVYAPFWFLAGLLVPPVYKVVHALAPQVGGTVERVVKDLYQRAEKSSAQPNKSTIG